MKIYLSTKKDVSTKMPLSLSQSLMTGGGAGALLPPCFVARLRCPSFSSRVREMVRKVNYRFFKIYFRQSNIVLKCLKVHMNSTKGKRKKNFFLEGGVNIRSHPWHCFRQKLKSFCRLMKTENLKTTYCTV